MKEIIKFIDSFKDFKNNYEFDNSIINLNTEVGKITSFYQNNNQIQAKNYILDLYKRIFTKNNAILTLKHPLYEMQTNAVCNFFFKGMDGDSWGNIVLFIDKDNKFPWLMLQVHQFFDFIFVANKIIQANPNKGNAYYVNQFYPWAKQQDLEKFTFKNKKFVFGFDQYRPYHFFQEDLYSSIYIQEALNKFEYASKHKGFFIFGDYIPNNECDLLIKPTLIMEQAFKKDDFINKILQDSLKNNQFLANGGGFRNV